MNPNAMRGPQRGPLIGVSGADDRARTGDLNLGKVALYQLSYVRVVENTLSRPSPSSHICRRGWTQPASAVAKLPDSP